MFILAIIIIVGPFVAERFKLPGDLVIVPGAILRRAIPSDAQRLTRAVAGINLIVAAGPYWLNLTSVDFSPEAKAVFPMSTSG